MSIPEYIIRAGTGEVDTSNDPFEDFEKQPRFSTKDVKVYKNDSGAISASFTLIMFDGENPETSEVTKEHKIFTEFNHHFFAALGKRAISSKKRWSEPLDNSVIVMEYAPDSPCDLRVQKGKDVIFEDQNNRYC